MRPSRRRYRARAIARSLGASGNNSYDAVVHMSRTNISTVRSLARRARGVFPLLLDLSRHGNGPAAPRADGLLAHPLGFDAARAQRRLPRAGGVGRGRAAPTRL